jgi:uncharacterized membrane-anchored protein
MPSLQDHPLRYQLANELHARPFPSMETPSRVVFLAIKRPTEAVSRDRSADVAHLIDLLDRHGAAHPQPGATHYSGQIGRYALKCISTRAFDPQDADVFPQDWLERAPGQRITSALIRVKRRDEDITRELGDWFVAESLAVSNVLDGAAQMAGDFRIDPAGHVRFAVFADAETGDRRVGRIVQRICEIETYKTMSMLGFERARQLSAKIDRLDTALTKLMDKMTVGDTQADEMLQHLLQISAELESLVARSSFRFEGTRAYNAIVNQRIAVLRETHFHGRQTFAEFMLRRFEPAMRTVESSERRLQALADRAMRAADLLRTSVDVERSAQNQALLVSMDRRADLALRLQQTVEGLSVVAISYYAVSLAGYALYPAAETLGVSKGLLTAAITLPVIALVWMLVRRIRRKHE